MMTNTRELAAKAARIGMWINVLAPAVMAAVAYGLKGAGVIPAGMLGIDDQLLFYFLGTVALSELVVAFILRKRLFGADRFQAIRHDPVQVERTVLRSSLVIFSLGASPMFYGAVLYLFTGDMRQLAFFGIITLLTYRFMRPGADFLDEILYEETAIESERE